MLDKVAAQVHSVSMGVLKSPGLRLCAGFRVCVLAAVIVVLPLAGARAGSGDDSEINQTENLHADNLHAEGDTFDVAIFAVQANMPPCTCRTATGDHPLGAELCLNAPAGPRKARCQMNQNITSWSFTDEGCNISTLTGPSTAATSGASGPAISLRSRER